MVPRDVERQPSPVMPGEEELPLCVGRLRDALRQHVGKGLGRSRGRAGPAACADDADDGAVIPDVVVELAECGVGVRLLAKVTLDLDEETAGSEVCRERITRLAELAGYG